MSHRTQITLTDAQYVRLKEESKRTGLRLAELVRQSLNKSMGGGWKILDSASILKASFGAWRETHDSGVAHVNKMRPGLGQKLGSSHASSKSRDQE